jgi:hypothetical protein
MVRKRWSCVTLCILGQFCAVRSETVHTNSCIVYTNCGRDFAETLIRDILYFYKYLTSDTVTLDGGIGTGRRV